MANQNNSSWERISQLYNTAIDITPADWQGWLKTNCTPNELDRGLDQYILKLLKGAPRAEAFFEALNHNIDDDISHKSGSGHYKEGDKFDKFRIIKELGKGGMAWVYLCERDDGQFDQKVALKIMQLKGDKTFMTEKFRQEQQILARINHPNIAQLFDGGITKEGFPYIIMEYVEGKPLDEYCDEQKSDIRERLNLFIQVCQALQYAHNNLIVHHDIKPANILVNKDGQIKLLDFGISQVLYSQAKEETRSSSFEGTLQYASPEQFHGAGPSIFSDIYKLGLVFFNLLTGKSYNFHNEKPEFKDILKQYLTKNQSPAKKLWQGNTSLLISDLNAILQKCLSEDPSQRFLSVSALCLDIENLLNNQTLHSHEPSLGYRVRKSYARNLVKVWMFSGFNIALIFLVVFLISQYQQTLQEKRRAEYILGFVWDVFESSDPEITLGDTITVYEMLENSLPRIAKLDKEPELQADLYEITGTVYGKLGFWQRGADFLDDALNQYDNLQQTKENKIKKAILLTNISSNLRNLSETQTADSIIDISLEIFNKNATRKDMEKYAQAITTKARIMIDKAKYAESIEFSERASELMNRVTSGPHIEKVRAQSHIAHALNYLSRYDEAIDAITESIAMINDLDQGENNSTLFAYGVYSTALAKKGNIDDAIEIDNEILRMKKQIYGEFKPTTLVTLSNIASKYFQLKRYTDADSINLIALGHYRELLGEDHNYTITTLYNLGNSYYYQQRYQEAIEYLNLSLEGDIRNLGETHPFLASSYQILGLINSQMDQLDQSELLFLKAIDILKLNFGEKHEHLSTAYSHLANLYCKQGRYTECKNYFEIAIDMSTEFLGSDHYATENIRERYKNHQDVLAGL